MAQGRPLSRHGRYEPFIGMPMGDPDEDELYKHSNYTSAPYTSPRPKSGYRRRRSSPTEYDQYARVTYPAESMREPPPARPQSRRGMDGYGGGALRRDSPDDSDEDSFPSPPSQPYGSPNSPTFGQVPPSHARPPSAASRPPTSGRPVSSRLRSARVQHVEQGLDDLPAVRPPSSFSKYRLLPAIGTPTPPDPGSDPPSYLNNDPSPPPAHHTYHQQPPSQPRNLSQNQSHNRLSSKNSSRVSSAVSDISVISTKASSRSRLSHNDSIVSEMVEKLDLSQLEKPESGKRRTNSVNSSPAHKAKPASQVKRDSGEIYDGDDDDSDTPHSESMSRDSEHSTQKVSKPALKQPVIIPSPDSPPDTEILLAVKLPRDGTRHQRYFGCQERLQAIVDFAEEMAGEDMGGYILVCSAPKHVYSDLQQTIEAAGLEDKTVLHLEECD